MAMISHNPAMLNADSLTREQLVNKIEEIDISTLKIYYPSIAKKINIGYLTFKSSQLNGFKGIPLVDPATLCLKRCQAIKKWLLTMISATERGLRATSIVSEYYHMRKFFSWCTDRGIHDLLDSPDSFHQQLIIYSKHCQAKVAAGASENYYRTGLDFIKYSGNAMFGDNYNFAANLARLVYDRTQTNHTEVPPESDITRAVKATSDLFLGLYDFIKHNRQFPHSIEVNGDKIWLVSNSAGLVISESVLLTKTSFGRPNERWRLVMDIASQESRHTGKALSQCIEDAVYATEKNATSNVDLEAQRRYELARLAHDCFVFEFALVTSANSAPMGQIEWLANSKIMPDGQGFRCIKFRADRNIKIRFGADFTEEFRLYLKIREVLLMGRQHDLLFGNFRADGEHQPLIPGGFYRFENRIINLVDHDFPKVGYRKIRAFGENYAQINGSAEVAADRSQHSITTALRSYTTGNTAKNASELTTFFTAVGFKLSSLKTVVETAASECTGHTINAVQIEEAAAIRPDCKNFLGCLFCIHFLMHGNEKDIRKIFSIIYVIEQFRPMQYSSEEFINSLNPTLQKARQIIAGVRGHSDSLLALANRIEKEVFENEDLDPYWLRKLNVLNDIGVI